MAIASSFVILGITDRIRMAIDGFEYQTVGMMVVFGCLSLLAIILGISGAIASRSNAKKAAAQQASATPAASAVPARAAAPAAATETITPELLAVISAAVSTALEGMNHRILEIKQAPYSGYSTSGRNEIFASHRIVPTSRQ